MKCQRFPRHCHRLIDRRAGRHTARKIGEGNAVIAIGILVDQRDVSGHGAHRLNASPACFSMLFSVPKGMSFAGWGTVTWLGRMPELDVAAFLAIDLPTVGAQGS